MGYLQGTNVGVAWGSSVTSLGYTGSGTITSTSDTTSYEADSTEIKDYQGDVVAVYYYNYRAKVSLTVFPSGTSPSLSIPAVGSVVTLYGDDSTITGNWVCTASSKAYKADGILEFSIELTSWSSLAV